MATVNITVDNDADFYQQFRYVIAEESGSPIDLTGGTMEMKLRRHVEDEAAFLRIGTDTGEIVFGTNTGEFSVMVPQAALLQLSLGEYIHSLILTMSGRKIKVWSGLFTVNAGASR
jgi:hypothetical protein